MSMDSSSSSMIPDSETISSSSSTSSQGASSQGAAATLSLNSVHECGLTSRKRSLAWVHFGKVDGKTAICDLCGEKIKTSGNTTNLMTHLKNYHATEYKAIEQHQKEKPSKKTPTNELAPGQLTLPGAIERNKGYPKDSFRRCLIDEALISMIATDLQPISIVEDQGFLQFLHVIDPKYAPPSRRSIMRDHLPRLYASKCAELKKELEGITHCSITTDCWTSRATEGYITVTCHYVTNDWELKSAVLNTTRLTASHTSENLAEALKHITDYWGISDKVHCCVSDSAANIKRAIHLNQWNHLPCLAHTINLIVGAAINRDEELVSLLDRVKKVVSFFHHSTKAMDTLRLNQTRLDLPDHKLVQQVDTRWNSTYYMVERYLEQQEAIRTTLCLLDRNDLLIPTVNNTVLQEAVTLLHPFENVTRELSSDKYTSGSKIIPISRCLQRLVSGQQATRPLATHLVNEMKVRFLNMEGNKMLALSTIVDPRFKKLPFADRDAAEKAVRAFVSEASATVHTTDDTSSSPSSNTASSSTSSSGLWQLFDEQVLQIQAASNLGASVYSEVQQFTKSAVVPRAESPLMWWKNNGHIYPNLVRSARQYLCVIATSVPAERLFSKAGELISMRRSTLKSENIDMMLFLNKN